MLYNIKKILYNITIPSNNNAGNARRLRGKSRRTLTTSHQPQTAARRRGNIPHGIPARLNVYIARLIV